MGLPLSAMLGYPASMTDETPRWRYRYTNFARALQLLREAADIAAERGLSQLEKEGVVQRFEFTWELARNLVTDYLQFTGASLVETTPRRVLREAIKFGLLDNGELWMEALDDRNRMAHTYSQSALDQVVPKVLSKYITIFELLNTFMIEKMLGDEPSGSE